jgi:hypothetical protein
LCIFLSDSEEIWGCQQNLIISSCCGYLLYFASCVGCSAASLPDSAKQTGIRQPFSSKTVWSKENAESKL